MASSDLKSNGRDRPLPFVYQFAAGAIAGVTEILAMYPLDVVKTRAQLSVGGGQQMGTVGTLTHIVKTEGFSRLYRGIIPPILMEAPKRATKFAANDSWGEFYRNFFGVAKMSQSLSILTGATAGATEAFVVVPFELVKIRLQDPKSTYTSTMDCLGKIVKNEGPLALYNGLEATLWRHIWWNAGYFGVIQAVRSALPKAESKSGETFNSFIAGAIGGTVGTILNTPFDVVKSRVQNTVRAPGIVAKYNWSWPSLLVVAREEGFGALYKGFVPKVLRLGPGGGVLLVVYSAVIEKFKDMREAREAKEAAF
ncbi:mitochondrial carrier [Saitoella complicata NRRL Y-17804]|nr:mitochondrial carrier [Saitoella complicata NRRL Y-17804]ODQ52446.1 mitochondrial carrier [Saitoella complicata NRRL Y-17804]